MREPPRHPHGWFAPLRASDVPRGKPVTFSFMGRELVAFRNRDGQVGVLESTCPHLGGHLGRGAVVAGCLRCPFHELAFDREGRCGVAPPHYQDARVERLRARVWSSIERYGMIFVWHGPDPAHPAWRLPLDDLDWEGWTTPVTNDGLPMPGTHPLWPAENIADLAHLRTVHRWEVLDVVSPPAERATASTTSRWTCAGASAPARRSPGSSGWARASRPSASWRASSTRASWSPRPRSQRTGSLQIRNLVLVNPVGERDAHLRVVVSVRRQFDAG